MFQGAASRVICLFYIKTFFSQLFYLTLSLLAVVLSFSKERKEKKSKRKVDISLRYLENVPQVGNLFKLGENSKLGNSDSSGCPLE